MARMFISYSRANRSFVEELVSLLARVFSDHRVWFDEHISGGEDWWNSILDEISSCDIFIYLLSNEAVESEHCQAEFREALRLRKLCLPVIIAPNTEISRAPETLEREIRRREWVDMSRGLRDYQANAKLYAAINRLLKRIPDMPLPPLSSERVDKPDTSPVSQRRAVRKGHNTRRVRLFSVLGLVGIIGISVIVVVIGWLGDQKTIALTATVETTPTLEIPTEIGVTQAWTDTPTATNTRVPTATLTPTLLPEVRALTPVASNHTWTPVQRDFDGVEMLLVPAGCFEMGDDPRAYYWGNNERIEGVPDGGQQCFNAPFWIDRYEVTNNQFAQFAGRAAQESHWTDPLRPRENITWFEARDFCAKRGARFPTSAEWEYAARGPGNLIFPWGNAFIPGNVVYNPGQDFDGPSAEVGSKPGGVSWVGAYDMSGNVWEWTSTVHSIYDPKDSRFTYVYSYPYISSDGRESAGSGDQVLLHIMRGGSWFNPLSALHAASYDAARPDVPGSMVGFRCAYSPQDNRITFQSRTHAL